jgi:chemotaxis protein histidine kinase CheA
VSTPGEGTRFVISLPLAPAVAPVAAVLSDERQYS